MKIKKDDKVQILAGKDKGKTGKVLQVFPARRRLSVEGVNLLIKHMRPQRKGDKGQRIEFPGLIDASNVALVCPKCGKPTRVSYQVTKGEDGKLQKARFCKQCQQAIA
jgi:large subunit ribosomal protein L24